jgi:SNF2 family DNA or RNA helicase
MNTLRLEDLHNYQTAIANHIIENPTALEMAKMGLGKTVSSLTAFNTLKYEMFQVSNAVVIAPKKVVNYVWKQEAAKWEHLQHLKVVRVIGTPKQREAALRSPADIHVVGRDIIPWVCAFYGGPWPFDMLIIDELSSFKNASSGRFKALKIVTPGFKRRVGMTGTPAPNSLEELWSQVYLLDGGERLGRFISHFRQKFFMRDGRGAAKGGRTFEKWKVQPNSKTLIYDAIADITLSLGLECLDMPELVKVDVLIELPAPKMKLYNKFKRDSYLDMVEGGGIMALNAAVLTGKLLQAANGAIYDADRKVHDFHSEKLDAAEELVEASNGNPVLILYAYQHDRDRLLKRFAKQGIEVLGNKDNGEDDSVARWNRREIPIMIMHPASGGHGLNLQGGGSTMIWYGMTWSLELYEQTVARLFRQGQVSETVSVYHLLCVGTMDVRVRAMLKGKRVNQEDLMNALKKELAEVIEIK